MTRPDEPELEGQEALFAPPPRETLVPDRTPKVPRYPIWTSQKARLIALYIKLFLYITKHGTYIDLFAGPQNAADYNTWAANLVLQVEPAWLRHFYLVETDMEKVRLLEELRQKHPDRDVQVFQRDCNQVIDRILSKVGPREATFALLDQRTFECHWATVEKLAEHKAAPETKIEQFYFLASGWLDRSISALTKNVAKADLWYGDGGWRDMAPAPGARAFDFAKRFKDVLGYAYAFPWEIVDERGRVMYHMIHASDHPEAPQLMARAYRKAWEETFPTIGLEQRFPGMEWPDEV